MLMLSYCRFDAIIAIDEVAYFTAALLIFTFAISMPAASPCRYAPMLPPRCLRHDAAAATTF